MRTTDSILEKVTEALAAKGLTGDELNRKVLVTGYGMAISIGDQAAAAHFRRRIGAWEMERIRQAILTVLERLARPSSLSTDHLTEKVGQELNMPESEWCNDNFKKLVDRQARVLGDELASELVYNGRAFERVWRKATPMIEIPPTTKFTPLDILKAINATDGGRVGGQPLWAELHLARRKIEEVILELKGYGE